MQDELYIRVKQALNWLKRNKGILQKDIADKMGMAESSFTRALARCKEKNDEDFVIAFHSAVNKYISLDYLLKGEGELILKTDRLFNDIEQELKDTQKTIERFGIPSEIPKAIDYSFLIEKAVEKATAYADKTIASLEDRIKDKDKYIELLEKRIADYEAAATFIHENNMLEKWPFPKGVAEEIKKRKELRV